MVSPRPGGSRRWVALLVAPHGAQIEHFAKGLELLGAAAVMMIGLALLAGGILASDSGPRPVKGPFSGSPCVCCGGSKGLWPR